MTVSGSGNFWSLFVDIAHLAASQIIEPVEVFRIKRNSKRRSGLVEEDDCLLQDAAALLHILPHGVQVGREVDGGRENAGLVLALRLAVELLPPLGHETERGLVGS